MLQVEFDDMAQVMSVFGPYDEYVKAIEKALGVAVKSRDNVVEVSGEADEDVRIAAETLRTLKKMLAKGEQMSEWMVGQAMDMVRSGNADDAIEAMSDVVAVTYRGKPVKCRTIGQKRYIKAIKNHTVTICIGPAGTGKTYLAIAMAVAALKRKECSRIILTRPAVEAGEKLGFLPGDLQSKVDPYLRPLYDALFDFLGQEQFNRLLENGTIEVAPLAYMRGRTLNDSMVILDEGQNATLPTLKMVLTRFGEGSKVILTGDITQIDLPRENASGLKKAADILADIEGISVVYLTNKDVVRHKLVKDIVNAFEKYEKAQGGGAKAASRRFVRKEG